MKTVLMVPEKERKNITSLLPPQGHCYPGTQTYSIMTPAISPTPYNNLPNSLCDIVTEFKYLKLQ